MPKRKIFTAHRAILLVFLLGIISLFFPQLERLPSSAKAEILSKIADADRIAIDPTIFPNSYRGPALRLSGRNNVSEFLQLITFEHKLFRSHCMCIGDVAIRFYREDKELIALTFHHGQSLRVLDANWARNSNLNLTAESRKDLAKWLTRNGYRSPPCSMSAPAVPNFQETGY